MGQVSGKEKHTIRDPPQWISAVAQRISSAVCGPPPPACPSLFDVTNVVNFILFIQVKPAQFWSTPKEEKSVFPVLHGLELEAVIVCTLLFGGWLVKFLCPEPFLEVLISLLFIAFILMKCPYCYLPIMSTPKPSPPKLLSEAIPSELEAAGKITYFRREKNLMFTCEQGVHRCTQQRET